MLIFLLYSRQWVPGCGIRLIVNTKEPQRPTTLFPNENKGFLSQHYNQCQSLTVHDYVDNIHVFTPWGHLTPTQILTLFNQFINWPEYENSAFNEMMEKHFEKIFADPNEDSHEIDNDNEEEEEENVEEVINEDR